MSDKDTADGLTYNALYMLDWQLNRADAGLWDAYTAPLLKAGANRVSRVRPGEVYGDPRASLPARAYTYADAQQMIARVDALIGAERSAA